jgi:hypothetical protein
MFFQVSGRPGNGPSRPSADSNSRWRSLPGPAGIAAGRLQPRPQCTLRTQIQIRVPDVHVQSYLCLFGRSLSHSCPMPPAKGLLCQPCVPCSSARAQWRKERRRRIIYQQLQLMVIPAAAQPLPQQPPAVAVDAPPPLAPTRVLQPMQPQSDYVALAACALNFTRVQAAQAYQRLPMPTARLDPAAYWRTIDQQHNMGFSTSFNIPVPCCLLS